jgi:hypothetical protein
MASQPWICCPLHNPPTVSPRKEQHKHTTLLTKSEGGVMTKQRRRCLQSSRFLVVRSVCQPVQRPRCGACNHWSYRVGYSYTLCHDGCLCRVFLRIESTAVCHRRRIGKGGRDRSRSLARWRPGLHRVLFRRGVLRFLIRGFSSARLLLPLSFPFDVLELGLAATSTRHAAQLRDLVVHRLLLTSDDFLPRR